MRERQPLALTSTPYFRAAVRIRRHAASRSDSLTPSTWSKRAMALRTCLASFSGSLRSLGNANVPDAIRFFCLALRAGERRLVTAMVLPPSMTCAVPSQEVKWARPRDAALNSAEEGQD